MTARGPTHVWRIAMIYALIDRSRIIRRPHLDAALAVWEYAERSTRYIFGDALGYPVADHILQKLRSVSPDGVTRTEIVDLFARHAKAQSLPMRWACSRSAALRTAGAWPRPTAQRANNSNTGTPQPQHTMAIHKNIPRLRPCEVREKREKFPALNSTTLTSREIAKTAAR